MEFDQLKKIYLGTASPTYLGHQGWQRLKLRLEQQESNFFQPVYGKRASFAFAVLLLVLTITAQNAKPGHELYPVKLLSDNIIATLTNRQELKIERRAQEIIEVSRTSNENLDEALQQYEKALSETSQQVKKSGNNENYLRSLNQQEERLKEEIENPIAREKVEESIKKTQEVKSEIKANKDRNNDKNNNGNDDERGNDSQRQNK